MRCNRILMLCNVCIHVNIIVYTVSNSLRLYNIIVDRSNDAWGTLLPEALAAAYGGHSPPVAQLCLPQAEPLGHAILEEGLYMAILAIWYSDISLALYHLLCGWLIYHTAKYLRFVYKLHMWYFNYPILVGLNIHLPPIGGDQKGTRVLTNSHIELNDA